MCKKLITWEKNPQPENNEDISENNHKISSVQTLATHSKNQKDFDNTAQVKNSTSTHPWLRNFFLKDGNLAVHLNCSTIQANAATKTITNKLVDIHTTFILLSLITGEGIILI